MAIATQPSAPAFGLAPRRAKRKRRRPDHQQRREALEANRLRDLQADQDRARVGERGQRRRSGGLAPSPPTTLRERRLRRRQKESGDEKGDRRRDAGVDETKTFQRDDETGDTQKGDRRRCAQGASRGDDDLAHSGSQLVSPKIAQPEHRRLTGAR